MSRERVNRIGGVVLWLMTSIAILVVLFLLMALFNNAQSHSWYDNDCCHERDCAPATVTLEGEQMVLSNQFGEAPMPQSMIPRASKDDKWHACFTYTRKELRCVYAPAGS